MSMHHMNSSMVKIKVLLPRWSRINNSIAIKQLLQNFDEFQQQQQQHILQKPSIPQQIIEEISVIEDKYLQQSITFINIIIWVIK